MENKKCCICNEKFSGWGNNPWGALDYNGHVIQWKDEDQCCDKCNFSVVIAGRLELSKRDLARRG